MGRWCRGPLRCDGRDAPPGQRPRPRSAPRYRAAGLGRHRADHARHAPGRDAGGELRRPGRGVQRPAGRGAAAQPVGQHAGRGSRPHRAARELAHGDLHQAGRPLRHHRARALRRGRDAQPVPGVRRGVRGTQQRRRGGPLRPARRPVAVRDADLLARPGAANPGARGSRARRRRSTGRPARRRRASPPSPRRPATPRAPAGRRRRRATLDRTPSATP
jgi:hypothetical protein